MYAVSYIAKKNSTICPNANTLNPYLINLIECIENFNRSGVERPGEDPGMCLPKEIYTVANGACPSDTESSCPEGIYDQTDYCSQFNDGLPQSPSECLESEYCNWIPSLVEGMTIDEQQAVGFLLGG